MFCPIKDNGLFVTFGALAPITKIYRAFAFGSSFHVIYGSVQRILRFLRNISDHLFVTSGRGSSKFDLLLCRSNFNFFPF